jgi:hypothetical protein
MHSLINYVTALGCMLVTCDFGRSVHSITHYFNVSDLMGIKRRMKDIRKK